ncbi:hypothetical protein HYR54_05205 [Candidatus Acetothermia bacterium]|nr:hypothetical protein [Candidatus Acetothermia bacterium]
MTLVHPLVVSRLLRERWLVSSHQFYPQVRLAIHPVLHLQDNVRQEQHSWLASSPHTSSLIGRRLFVQHLSLRAFSAESRTFSSQVDSESVMMVSQNPLQLVFHRLQQTDEIAQVHRRSEITRENLQTLVNRVVQQTQRVEERFTQSPALITRQAAAKRDESQETPSPARADQFPTDAPFSGSGSTNPWVQRTTQLPAVNVEQITDHVMKQLDRRITYWRERTGRVF